MLLFCQAHSKLKITAVSSALLKLAPFPINPAAAAAAVAAASEAVAARIRKDKEFLLPLGTKLAKLAEFSIINLEEKVKM